MLNKPDKDSKKKPQSQFASKYVVPAMAIFFSWGFFGHLYFLNIDTKSLYQKKGKVVSIEIKMEHGSRSIYYPLKIGLSNYETEFRLPETYKKDFPYLQEMIFKGDSVTLFTRSKWQTIIGWGKQNDIYQIDKEGQTLFDISNVNQEQKSQAMIFAFLTFIFWAWYFIYRYTKKVTDREKQNTH